MRRIKRLWLLFVPPLLAAASVQASPTTVGDFHGTWKTNWGTLTVTQNGTHVTGAYTHKGGRLFGIVSGRTLTGTWSELPDYRAPHLGPFVFTISLDGKAFTGKWRYAASKSWVGTWNGTLQATATSFSWAGRWETNWGALTLTQSGTTVTGSYTHDGGKITGTVSGTTLTGTWSEGPTFAGPNDAGPLVFKLGADGKSFSGLWNYEGKTPDKSWNGTRAET